MESPPIAGRGLVERESCWATRGWERRRFGKGFGDSEKCFSSGVLNSRNHEGHEGEAPGNVLYACVAFVISSDAIGLAAAVFLVLFEDEMIGHAGNVVAYYAWERVFFCLVLIGVRQGFRMQHPEIE